MSRCRFLWMWFGLVVGLGTVVPAAAVAEGSPSSGPVSEGIRCENMEGDFDESPAGVERVPHAFGDQRALLAVRCRSKVGERFWNERLEISVWDDGEEMSHQTLFNGIVGGAGLRYEVDASVGRVRLRFDCAGRDARREAGGSKWCRRVWQWSSIYDRLIETSEGSDDRKSEQYYVRQFETSLARDAFDDAARAVVAVAERTGPENADWHMELNRRFFEEVLRRAETVRDKKRPTNAAAIVADACTERLPERFEEGRFGSGDVVRLPTVEVRGHDDQREWRRRGRALLPRSAKSAEIVGELAEILTASEVHRPLARRLLARSVRAYPDRVDLRLQLADVLWDLGRRAEARKHYRKCLEVADGAEQEGASLPDRVEQRAEEK